MPPVNTIQGLASGYKTADMIDALITAERGGARVLESKQKLYNGRLEAARTFNVRALSAKLDLIGLRRASNFSSRSVESSAATVATAKAGSQVPAGSYQVTVDRLAQAQQLITGGFASSTASIGTGTVSIRLGDGPLTQITLDAAHSSLAGLVSAINASGAQVSAQVLNDGSATPYRLALTSKLTGAAKTITFDADGLAGASPDQLQRVETTGTSGSYTGVVSLSGAYTGTDGPPEYRIRILDAAPTAVGAGSFAYSTDGGTTWSAPLATSASPVSLGNGVAVAFSASGQLDLNDAFTLRPLKETVAAQDAKIRFGAGAVTITSATNTVADVVPGLSLDLKSMSVAPITLTVHDDPTAAKDAVTKFVASFNAAADYLHQNTGYDAVTKSAGILQSQTSLLRGLDDLTRALTTTVPGLPSVMNALSAVGVTLSDKGQLDLDAAKLDAALATDQAAVGALFTNTGASTLAGVEFVALGPKTVMTGPFDVRITQAASQPMLTGGPLAGTTTITSGNNALRLMVNGVAVDLALVAGSYTPQQLANHVQSLVSAKSELSATPVKVSLVGGNMVLTSSRYGSAQSIKIVSGTAAGSLGFAAGALASGSDVAGTINGTAVTGQGQALDGKAGTAADGLTLLVTLTAAQVASGSNHATVTLRKGIAQGADEALAKLTDSHSGSAPMYTSTLQSELDAIAKQIKRIDASLDSKRARLQAQFNQMEKLMQSFQTQGNFITQFTGGLVPKKI